MIIRKTIALVTAICVCAGFSVSLPPITASAQAATGAIDERFSGSSREGSYSYYYDTIADKPRPAEQIVINAADYKTAGGDAEVTVESSFEGHKDILKWSNDSGTVEWEFDVKTSGSYNLSSIYYGLEGKNTIIEFELLIDGKQMFDACGRITLDRLWKNEHKIVPDEKDNQLRPPQVELHDWVNAPVKDKDGLFNEPYFFYLEAGKHTFTINAVKVTTAFESFTFYNSDELVPYADIKPTQEQIEQMSPMPMLTLEAEEADIKTASTIYPTYDRNSYTMSPSHPVKMRFNTLGQGTWNKSTQAASWYFSVPYDGYYKFSLKVNQSTMRGFYSNRRIMIDDVVPCEELDQYRFKYDLNWYTEELKDDNGETIYLYLTAGKHKFTMEAVPGDIGESMRRLDDVVFELNKYYRRIIMITGPSPDALNDYFIDTQIPELLDKFRWAVDQLYTEKAQIEEISKGSEASSLEATAIIINRCIEKPDRIPSMVGTIRDTISSLSAWMRTYRDQPLEMDFLQIATPDSEFTSAKGNILKEFAFGFNAFIGSFFEDYSSISGTRKEAINVWISLGRDQAQVVKEMVDSDFKQKFNYDVTVNLVQGSIMEATLANKGPEVALFLGGSFPIDLAARGLLIDLKKFYDFEEVKTRFAEQATVLYEFMDGVYALPISQTFPMLFYRKDVLAEIGINNPPETWDEYIKMLPELQRKFMQSGLILPAANSTTFEPGYTFIMLMLQTGQSFYNQSKTATNLSSEMAIKAFTDWTKFYTLYSFEQVYDPFTRFRTGEMPFVIQNYTFYNQLSVAAPEIKGLWDFTLVPGTEQADGTVSHAANSAGSGGIIFKKVRSEKAAWEFLKWFTDTDVQVQYGRTIEAVMGPMGRFDTANVEALSQLSWSPREHEKIAAQMDQLVEIPIIPASYTVTRNVIMAFRRVVNDYWDARYAITQYNRDINQEIERKNEELGISQS